MARSRNRALGASLATFLRVVTAHPRRLVIAAAVLATLTGLFGLPVAVRFVADVVPAPAVSAVSR